MVAGCDVGSLTAKAVIMDDEKILSTHVVAATASPVVSAKAVMDAALSQAGLDLNDLEYIVGTGYGRKQIAFVHDVVSEIVCHGKAVNWLVPSARTVIDVGGQDAKAIRLDSAGDIVRYAYNDRCATGTGRFLEIMADALELRLEDMGEVSLRSRRPAGISNQCTVFAESEVVSLVNDGKAVPDIVSGLHRAMAFRVAALAKSIEVAEDVVMSGGVAKNVGLFSVLGDVLGVKMKKCGTDPQINGALGAALIARAAVRSKAR
ncbi:MAG TPA: acyl-CoA dehydratase activase [Deltaproteobacteria bacterium]|nr:acyl-CoA dehydratase activase [Deltaproteobacteria bacterium]